MKSLVLLHRGDERGYTQSDWLTSFHSFSFARYVDREKVNFGALRVINEDVIAPERGFGKHSHDNMEIITIPLEGSLAHQDSMGNQSVIKTGEIQVMSAGTGVFHSEHNASTTDPVHLLQIWVVPNQLNVQPRYQQVSFDHQAKNIFQLLVSPEGNGGRTWIHQEAWFSIGEFDNEHVIEYTLHNKQSGVYAFVIKGEAIIDGVSVAEKDALGVTGKLSLAIESTAKSTKILLIEVPMQIS